MPSTPSAADHRFAEYASDQPIEFKNTDPSERKPPQREGKSVPGEPLLTVEEVARRLNVSRDWCGTTPPERSRCCLSFGWAMGHSDTVGAP